MADLRARNVDDAVVAALKVRAKAHGITAEAEHRRILADALALPHNHHFVRALSEMPDVGEDVDFERVHEHRPGHGLRG